MKSYSDSGSNNPLDHKLTDNKKLSFPCPRCQEPSTLVNNPSKPFCSERCKLIDLGAWANEDYKVAANDSPMGSELDRF